MAKKLSDVLAGTNKSRTRPGSTGTRPGVDYAAKMKDERDFVASHEVQEFDDRVGNGSDVYNATNIKHAPDVNHGHIPKPEDEKQYKQANESVVSEAKKEPEEDATDEKEMMKNQLSFIKLASDKIMDHINSTKDPEEWFQNKLSGLHANMKDLHAYVAGDKGEVKEEAEQIDEISVGLARTYGGKALRAGLNAKSKGDDKTARKRFKGANLASAKAFPNQYKNSPDKAKVSATNEEAAGDPRVEPKDVKTKGKSLKMITGQVKESNHDGSRTKTGTEQARARFDKKMERKEMQKEREENDH